MTNIDKKMAERLSTRDSEMIAKQVTEWQREIDRLHGLIAHATGATPDGWRKVPRLPLPSQLRAAQHLVDVETAKAVYLSMVDAAPKS